MSKKPKSNNIVFRPGINIGHISAESDSEFLFPCFVDHHALHELTDLDNSKMLLVGRTGAGKTAILRKIENDLPNVSEVELPDLAMNYIANSDIIQFLNAIDVDLDLFFQVLWKHIFCIEYIRCKFDLKNESESRSFFSSISNFFSLDQRKGKALKYLEKWQDKFWITMDQNIQEITEQVENSIEAELSGELNKFKGRAGYATSLSTEKKTSLSQRAKNIIYKDLLSDLAKVLEILSGYETKTDKYRNGYYVLVDRLDEKWVDGRIRYDLIKALIECLKGMRKIRDLKIIVSIREDVLEKVIQMNDDPGFQREKYHDHSVKLKWSETQLKEVINNRINHLFKHQYHSQNVFFEHIFEQKVGTSNTLSYMLKRTLLRPRDIISFVNECLKISSERSAVSQRAIRRAEREYSRLRLEALSDEWRSAFPSLDDIFDKLTATPSDFHQSTGIWEDDFLEDLFLKICSDSKRVDDPIYMAAQIALDKNDERARQEFAQSVLSVLYRIGAVGLKMNAQDPYWYSFKDTPVIGPGKIAPGTKVQVHEMLMSALNMRPIKSSIAE